MTKMFAMPVPKSVASTLSVAESATAVTVTGGTGAVSLVAMAAGSLSWVPAGETSPVGVGDAAADRLVLQVRVDALAEATATWGPGVPGVHYIVYEGVDRAAVKSLLPALVAKLTAGEKKALGLKSTSLVTDAERVFFAPDVAARRQLSVEAGAKIGASVATGVTLHLVNADGLEAPVLTPMRALPYLADYWLKLCGLTDHPLKRAAPAYTETVALHLRFVVIDEQGKQYPLKGAAVTARNERGAELSLGASAKTDENGLLSVDRLPRPDFQGASFAMEMGLPTTVALAGGGGGTRTVQVPGGRWSTQRVASVHRGVPGMFRNFSGFQLGMPQAPLVFAVPVTTLHVACMGTDASDQVTPQAGTLAIKIIDGKSGRQQSLKAPVFSGKASPISIAQTGASDRFEVVSFTPQGGSRVVPLAGRRADTADTPGTVLKVDAAGASKPAWPWRSIGSVEQPVLFTVDEVPCYVGLTWDRPDGVLKKEPLRDAWVDLVRLGAVQGTPLQATVTRLTSVKSSATGQVSLSRHVAALSDRSNLGLRVDWKRSKKAYGAIEWTTAHWNSWRVEHGKVIHEQATRGGTEARRPKVSSSPQLLNLAGNNHRFLRQPTRVHLKHWFVHFSLRALWGDTVYPVTQVPIEVSRARPGQAADKVALAKTNARGDVVLAVASSTARTDVQGSPGHLFQFASKLPGTGNAGPSTPAGPAEVKINGKAVVFPPWRSQDMTPRTHEGVTYNDPPQALGKVNRPHLVHRRYLIDIHPHHCRFVTYAPSSASFVPVENADITAVVEDPQGGRLYTKKLKSDQDGAVSFPLWGLGRETGKEPYAKVYFEVDLTTAGFRKHLVLFEDSPALHSLVAGRSDTDAVVVAFALHGYALSRSWLLGDGTGDGSASPASNQPVVITDPTTKRQYLVEKTPTGSRVVLKLSPSRKKWSTQRWLDLSRANEAQLAGIDKRLLAAEADGSAKKPFLHCVGFVVRGNPKFTRGRSFNTQHPAGEGVPFPPGLQLLLSVGGKPKDRLLTRAPIAPAVRHVSYDIDPPEPDEEITLHLDVQHKDVQLKEGRTTRVVSAKTLSMRVADRDAVYDMKQFLESGSHGNFKANDKIGVRLHERHLHGTAPILNIMEGLFELHNEYNLVLFNLKVAYEFKVWTHRLTKGKWDGFGALENKVHQLGPFPPRLLLTKGRRAASSYGNFGQHQLNTIVVVKGHRWMREVLAHEMCHHLQYQHMDYAYARINYADPHSLFEFSNQDTAWLEGLADFFGVLFRDEPIPYNKAGWKRLMRGTPRVPPARRSLFNQLAFVGGEGEGWEGAVCMAMLEFFEGLLKSEGVTLRWQDHWIGANTESDVTRYRRGTFRTADYLLHNKIPDLFVKYVVEPTAKMRRSERRGNQLVILAPHVGDYLAALKSAGGLSLAKAHFQKWKIRTP